MKARPFSYARPATLDEASALLRQSPGAVALAGGQSLVQALVLRERAADLLVDLTRIPALRGVAVDGAGLRVGAGIPMWELERDPLIAAHSPLLVRAIRTVGAPGIRSRATLGGSAAWCDPTSQLPATLLALGARCTTTARDVPAEDLFSPPRGTALRQGEIIVSFTIPSAPGVGHGLQHVRRSHITWPVAGAAVLSEPTRTRVALYGAAPRPVCAEGRTPADAAEHALAKMAPFDDERASAGYRASVLPALVKRALAEAGAPA